MLDASMHLLVALRKRYPCDEGHASGISTLMPMETVLNVLHVLAAVFIIGPMAILPMTAMRAIRGGDGAQCAAWHSRPTCSAWRR